MSLQYVLGVRPKGRFNPDWFNLSKESKIQARKLKLYVKV